MRYRSEMRLKRHKYEPRPMKLRKSKENLLRDELGGEHKWFRMGETFTLLKVSTGNTEFKHHFRILQSSS